MSWVEFGGDFFEFKFGGREVATASVECTIFDYRSALQVD